MREKDRESTEMMGKKGVWGKRGRLKGRLTGRRNI